MTSAIFAAFVDDTGQFALDDKASFRAYVQKFKGCEVVVSVKRKPQRQGNQQMRYLRGVVIPDVATACGYSDPDDWQQVFEGLAWKFLRLPDGQFGEPRRRSTAKDQMSQEEMSKFIDDVILYAESSIPGCRVRRPEEIDFETVIDPEWS